MNAFDTMTHDERLAHFEQLNASMRELTTELSYALECEENARYGSVMPIDVASYLSELRVQETALKAELQVVHEYLAVSASAYTVYLSKLVINHGGELWTAEDLVPTQVPARGLARLIPRSWKDAILRKLDNLLDNPEREHAAKRIARLQVIQQQLGLSDIRSVTPHLVATLWLRGDRSACPQKSARRPQPTRSNFTAAPACFA